MKLHLPYQLYRVLLAVFVGIPALTPFAIAEDLIYKEQESALYGGAICNNQISRPYLAEEYDTVLFDTNRAARSGGAIYNVGTMSLSENGSITFLNNTTGGMGYTGGAIYNKGSFVMSGNTGEILFEGNKAALEQGPGCAVYNEGAFTMNMADNKNIRFTQNSTTRGGAIAYKEGTQGILSLGQNSLVTFSGNTASEVGGAIAGFISSNSLSVCSMRLVGNESVVFELNVAGTYEGAIANYYYTSSSPDKNLNNSSNNEQVRFFGNRAKHGGAIANYFNAIPPGSSGNITMSGNGKVLFENNCATEKGGPFTIKASVAAAQPLSQLPTTSMCSLAAIMRNPAPASIG